MSDNTTIARPYAKAIFQVALDLHQLSEWSGILQTLAQSVLEPAAESFILNPAVTTVQQSQLIMSVFDPVNYGKIMPLIESVVNLLALNRRLLVLPDIYAQFEVLRAEQEKTLTVQVSSFASLTHEQQQQLMTRLSQRLQRQVTLDVSIDASLLGGAIIRAGDLVIDGSVRGKLNKLANTLAA